MSHWKIHLDYMYISNIFASMLAFARYSRKSLAWVAILTLGLHSLIPAGYMPDFSAHGFSLTICDGTDHQSVSNPPMEHMHHAHGGAQQHAGTCPFSVGTIFTHDTVQMPPIASFVFALVTSATALPLPIKQPDFASGASPRSPPFFS